MSVGLHPWLQTFATPEQVDSRPEVSSALLPFQAAGRIQESPYTTNKQFLEVTTRHGLKWLKLLSHLVLNVCENTYSEPRP